jgi:hypothetical protein
MITTAQAPMNSPVPSLTGFGAVDIGDRRYIQRNKIDDASCLNLDFSRNRGRATMRCRLLRQRMRGISSDTSSPHSSFAY